MQKVVDEVSVTSFRNIKETCLKISGFFCFLCGENGSGKTSFLEALYFLSYGRSFRASSYKKIINFEADFFSVYAKKNNISPQHLLELAKSNSNELNGSLVNLLSSFGVSKAKDGKTTLFVNYEKTNSFFDIAANIPVLLINNQSYLLLEGEPAYRRKFVDWVLFHVEQGFLYSWQKFKKTLAQRNALIKSLEDNPYLLNTLDYWDENFVKHALEIDVMRKKIIDQFELILHEVLNGIEPLKKYKVAIKYREGWKKEFSLEEAIFNSRGQDISFKTTTQGPHRADLVITVNNKLAKHVLSRGQTKLLVLALDIARVKLVETINADKKILFLVDDVFSELDRHSSAIFLNELKYANQQTIFTGVFSPSNEQINTLGIEMFHVEHGNILV